MAQFRNHAGMWKVECRRRLCKTVMNDGVSNIGKSNENENTVPNSNLTTMENTERRLRIHEIPIIRALSSVGFFKIG